MKEFDWRLEGWKSKGQTDGEGHYLRIFLVTFGNVCWYTLATICTEWSYLSHFGFFFFAFLKIILFAMIRHLTLSTWVIVQLVI